jgi:hypothetical protein
MTSPLSRAFWSICFATTSLVALSHPSRLGASEVIVKNDGLVDGGTANIQAGFVAGERAAVWLTSPCEGTIVGVQVFWRSLSGNAALSLEESITIYAAGTFPNPGATLALLEGPVMNDGVLNEFRYLDENQTIPLSVPVSTGQVFIVSFQFANSVNQSQGPSVVTDLGCQGGKNSLFAIPPSVWFNSCSLGLSGDFVIRAVVNCTSLPGACCVPNGTCLANQTQTQCLQQGGLWKGEGSTCGATTCNQACCYLPNTCQDRSVASCNSTGGFPQGLGTVCATTICFPIGACCKPDGTCENNMSPAACTNVGGTFQGANSQCINISCPQPLGACCYQNGFCEEDTSELCLGVPGAHWKGPFTTCFDGNDNQIADACEDFCGGTQHGDFNNDGLRNGKDIHGFIDQYVNPDIPGQGDFCEADFDENTTLTVTDVNMFVDCLLHANCGP